LAVIALKRAARPPAPCPAVWIFVHVADRTDEAALVLVRMPGRHLVQALAREANIDQPRASELLHYSLVGIDFAQGKLALRRDKSAALVDNDKHRTVEGAGVHCQLHDLRIVRLFAPGAGLPGIASKFQTVSIPARRYDYLRSVRLPVIGHPIIDKPKAVEGPAFLWPGVVDLASPADIAV
jgi:hypothetical protein